ncbi:MAG: Tetratricopeptide repeat protein [Deltaproteobacteria bacterium ADurb.Bin207]|jgi:tetratricopeptide (TPR) repeat protein|nr:MAG: Tetratricopeptide repeat protein [Deltaproteobacteria bacterium ADurb.Bin207]
MQLSACRGGLALELAEPFTVGPLTVTRLVSSLQGLSFPIDLTGGVGRFRHRRGVLDHLVVESQLAQLAMALQPRARAVFDSPKLRLSLLPTALGLSVGVCDEDRALSFSAHFTSDGPTLQFVVSDARAVGFGFHSHALAVRLARALTGCTQSQGSLISLERGIAHLVREVLLDAGARLPSCQQLQYAWDETLDGIRLTASSAAPEACPAAEVLRAIELATIARQGDEALVAGNFDDARAAYVTALESAPRHPDLALRIAEIDLLAGYAPESALASLVETMPALDGGLIGAELLAALGDRQASVLALRRAADREPFAPMAARMLGRAAAITEERSDRLSLLDEALARCVGCESIRWQRAITRLEAGCFSDAIADLGHLEAAAQGAEKRYQVCLRAGQHLLQARLALDARTFFEKALRYAPRSAQASSGLARAFYALGDGRRAVRLLTRATELSGSSSPPPTTLLELATAIVEFTRDYPAAIYHVRSIPFGLPQTVAARALEGRWRNQLGDIVGASHAFSQAREAAAQLPRDTIAEQSQWLIEAAQFELDIRNDPRVAKRHVELALQADPNNPHVQQVFRRAVREEQQAVATRMDPVASPESHDGAAASDSPLVIADEPITKSAVSSTNLFDPASTSGEIYDEGPLDANEEAQIEVLEDRVLANPNDQETIRQLSELLDRGKQYPRLLALVSARLDETSEPSYRAELMAMRIHALQQLMAACRAQGNEGEAELYEAALADATESSSDDSLEG